MSLKAYCGLGQLGHKVRGRKEGDLGQASGGPVTRSFALSIWEVQRSR